MNVIPIAVSTITVVRTVVIILIVTMNTIVSVVIMTAMVSIAITSRCSDYCSLCLLPSVLPE